MNRRLGRVGMPVGSMVVSRGSSASSSGASYFGSSVSDSGRTYVDNSTNRSLGRVGMPVGSMVVSSKGSSASTPSTSFFGSSSSDSGRTYVDNAMNRDLGRVGMPVGSMPVSKSSSGSSSSSKTYVDNEYNRSLGRVGMEHGSMVVSKNSGTGSSSGTKHYVDNSANRSLGRVGLPYGACGEEVRVYKDNPFNRKLGRAGLPVGAAVKSKSGSLELKLYADNPENRRLGRVGFPLGSRPKGSFTGSKRTYCDNYLNRQLGRVGKELGTEPVTCSKETEWLHKAYIRYRENPNEDIDYGTLPALPEEVEEDAIEKLMHLINRLQIEREWRETEKQTKPVPKTSDDLLSYTGPILEFSDIKLGKIIGRGGFGVVHYGEYKDSVVAVKKLHVMRVSKRRQKEFIDEVNILSKLDNPFIVKFIGACTTTPNLCIVMEYMQMSLHEALHVDCADLADFTDGDRLMMITQTLTGLEYLHDKKVAHCDIKSRNVLIDHDGEKFTVAKLTDFGLSMMKNETETSLSSNSELVRHIGTPRYSSPEVLRGELMNLDQMKMSDMYSYGLVVFEIVCEEEPFPNLSAAQLRTQVGEKNMYPKFPEDIHPNVDLAAKLLGCWDRKPENRPTATDFLKVMNRISCVYETVD